MSLNKEKIELSNWELVSVNPNSKNWNWTDIFCFWSVGTQSIISFALISSLYLLYDLNFYEVFFGTIIASLLIIKYCWITISKTWHTFSCIFKNIFRLFRCKIYFTITRSCWNIFFWSSNLFYIKVNRLPNKNFPF